MFSIRRNVKLIALVGLSLIVLGYAFINKQSNVSVRKTDTSVDFFNNPFEAKSGVAIIDAVNAKDENLIKQIIAKGLVNEKDSNGNNAMHIIARKGHYIFPPNEIPKSLIVGGINIDEKNNENKSALEISLLSGWQKISMLLLDNNADRSVVTKEVVDRITCPDCKKVVKEYKLL
jgi:ankyrin repeat protein